MPTGLLVLLLCHPTLLSFKVGLAVALTGEALRIWGVGYSGTTTREGRVIAPQLVTAGPYAYVRNPLYVGNFVTALGFLIIGAGGLAWWLRIALTVLIVGSYGTVYGIIIPLEEEYLQSTFGRVYSEYKRAVPRVVPRLTPYVRQQGTFHWSVIRSAEIHTLALFFLMGCVMAAKLLLESMVWMAILRVC